MGKGIERKKHDGSGLRIGIAVSRWNTDITGELLVRCRQALADCGVENVEILETPGSFELPLAAQTLLQKNRVDAVIALGCLIKGETMHFEYICSAVSQGVMRVGLDNSKPVVFGVLTCLTLEQAQKRSDQNGLDHGYEWGLSAVEAALLCSK